MIHIVYSIEHFVTKMLIQIIYNLFIYKYESIKEVMVTWIFFVELL